MLDLWESKNLAIGIHELDRQHLELVHILQQVNDLSRNSLVRQRIILPEIIQKLFYYSQYHFTYEESLMSRASWTGLPAHRELHKVFIKAVLDYSNEYQKRHWEGMTDQIILWLKDWTVHHILEEDRRFKVALTPGGNPGT
jgi:hemerythrin-like metal-binding protein